MKISMRDEKSVLKVIDLCAVLEERALGIYETLLDSAEDERLRDLWSTMVADEKEHRDYWLRLKDLCADGGVPEVFDEPRRYVDELQALMLRLDHIADHVKTEYRTPEVFVHTLRLEFLLLHPSFVILFNYLPREEDRDVAEPQLRTAPRQAPQCHDGLRGPVAGDGAPRRGNRPGLEEERGRRHPGRDRRPDGHTQQEGALHRHEASRLSGAAGAGSGGCDDPGDQRAQGDQRHLRPQGRRQDPPEAAKIVSRRLRASDVVGRFGGDDFLALLTRFDLRHFQTIGEEIASLVGEVAVGEAKVKLTVGGACAVMGEDVEEMLESLIRGADGALDDARKEGKGCVVRELGTG